MSGQRVRSDQWVRELSDHLCECGCGQRTYIAPRTYSGRGVFKGRPRRFVPGHAGALWQRRRAAASDLVRPVRWRPCACGCGVWSSWVAQPGHRRPDPFRMFSEPIGPPRACACGCGRSAGTLAARWLRGHQNRDFGPEYVVDQDTGCWVWQRSLDASGYGRIGGGGSPKKAHRVFYEERHGEGSALGLEVHHECGEKLCVNPDHLVALRPIEHARIHAEMARELWRLRREAA